MLLNRESKSRRSTRSPKPNAVQFLYDRYVGKDPERIKAYEQEVLNAKIARQIFDLRTKSGIT